MKVDVLTPHHHLSDLSLHKQLSVFLTPVLLQNWPMKILFIGFNAADSSNPGLFSFLSFLLQKGLYVHFIINFKLLIKLGIQNERLQEKFEM